jgi:hypothetical protein
MQALGTLIKRILIVIVLIALISPFVAHNLWVDGWHHLMILIFGNTSAHLPSLNIHK